MIGERRKHKGLLSIIIETFKDFAENTSIHGLKYTVKNEFLICERLFWAVVVLGGLSGAGYMTVLFWDRYTSNPTRTSIATAFAPASTLPFPAVTLCNTNRIIASKVDDFVAKLDMRPERRQIVRRAFPQLLGFTSPSIVDYNTTELEILQEVLHENDFYDINLIVRKISENCKEMLLKCQWEFYDVACSELFQETFTPEGVCCSFNSLVAKKNRLFRTIYTGFGSGMILLLNSMPQPIQYSPIQAGGLRVLIHDPQDYPGVGAITKISSNGVENYLQILATGIICSKAIHALSPQQRNSVFPYERELSYFDGYAHSNCITECEADNFHLICGCVPFYLHFTGRPVCNVTKIPCIKFAQSPDSEKLKKDCDCPPQCEDIVYEVFSASTKLYLNATWTLSSFYGAFLASFGGVFSLFLGCSFITLIEIIYYGILRFAINIKILGRIGTNNVHQEKRENTTDMATKRNEMERKLYNIKLWDHRDYYE